MNIEIRNPETISKINEIAEWYDIDKAFILKKAIGKYHAYHKDKRQRRVSSLRWYLRKRQNSLCFYCGKYLHNKDTTTDHKIPWARGGGNSIKNLVAACGGCNNAKADMTVEEFQEFQSSMIPDVEIPTKDDLLQGII